MATLGVTGASGLIGGQVVELARTHGHQLRMFSRKRPGAEPLDLAHGQVDPAPFVGCDTIIHLAARLPSEEPDILEARDCFDVNVLGTLKLLEAMARAGVRRLIQATAANAYAPWCEFPDEQSPLYPVSRSYYLGSKVMQELYAHAFGAAHGVKVTSLRISSPYGASPRSAIGRIGAALLETKPVRLRNGGAFGADFVSVRDVAEALLLVEKLQLDGVWNVASGRRTTMLEVSRSLAVLTGADPSLIQIDAPGKDEFRGYPAIDIAKIRTQGFEPTELETGLEAMVDELRSSGSSSFAQPR